MKRIKLVIIILATVSCLLAGCGDDGAQTASVHYEKVLDTLTAAVSMNDTEAYLLCFTEAARLNYKASDRYDRGLAGKIAVKDEGKSLALVCTANEHRELNEDEIVSLEGAYKEKYSLRIDITKAYDLNAVFTSGSQRAERTVYVVKTSSDWFILGPVIERIFEDGAPSASSSNPE